MRTTHWLQFHFEQPKLSLTLYFLAWKALLLVVALSSPGPGYDTSTVLTLELDSYNHQASYQYSKIIQKLTRWDAIWFTEIAHSGYTYEQQWMAGWGFTKLLGSFHVLKASHSPTALAAAVGILIAHISHLLSILVLYELSSLLFLQSYPSAKRSSIAWLAACLHLISPAGMFLSAPYAESLFSLITFSGFYLYGRSSLRHPGESELLRHLFLLSSGLCLGIASTIRGNGLLSGLVFVYEVIIYIWTGVSRDGFSNSVTFQRFCAVQLTGVIMGCVVIFPQYLAYLEYCTPSPKRPWCSQSLPSIYGWVQTKYWNVGFLHYWTFANLPSFILALPMLSITYTSGIWAWFHTKRPRQLQPQEPEGQKPTEVEGISKSVSSDLITQDEMLRRLAIPQMFLAVLALTTYHVQIITRLSSGYPVWYWWLAHVIVEDDRKILLLGRRIKLGASIVKWMVMYAIIQGGLFASFLPPA